MLPIIVFILVYSGLLILALKKPEAAIVFSLFFLATSAILFDKLLKPVIIKPEHVALLILILITIIHKGLNKRFFIKIVSNPIFIALLIMFFYMSIYDIIVGIDGREKYIWNFFIVLLLGTLGALNLKNVMLNQNLNFGFLFSIIATVIVWLAVLNIQDFDISHDRSLLASDEIGSNTITFGREVGLVFCISFFQLFAAKRKMEILVLSIIAIFSIYYVFITGTRGVFISIIIVFFIVLLKKIKKENIRYLILAFILLIIAVNFIDTSNYALLQRLELTEKQGVKDDGRYLLYFDALKIFADNPFKPLGPAGFLKLNGMYPHNLILELLVDYGWISIFVIPMLVVYGLIQAIKLLYNPLITNSVKLIPFLWAYYFFNTMFSGDIIINKLFFILSICLISVIIIAPSKNINKMKVGQLPKRF